MNRSEQLQRIQDLQIERACGIADEAALAELETLLAQCEQSDDQAFDLALAAIITAEIAGSPETGEALPEHVQTRISAAAREHLGASERVVPLVEKTKKRAMNWPANIGWAIAAGLALLMWLSPDLPDAPRMLPPADARSALLREAPDVITLSWQTPESEEFDSVRGDVVWSDERQEGYLLLTGMPANNAAVSQYQLWIVDPERDKNPVDGGVFDIPQNIDTVVVPIKAKLTVDDPAAFAITREQAGGVVVSDGPLLVVASSG